MDWHRDGYLISTDRSHLDIEAIWGFLRTSYWATGVSREKVEASIENSLPFGLYEAGGGLAGFARVVTDTSRFAFLADVFVLEAHRGRGLGVWLVETILGHPELRGLRFLLATEDAHGLYARFGFREVVAGRMMERPGAS
jgi:GNAT superfamily N-acetyltransferase